MCSNPPFGERGQESELSLRPLGHSLKDGATSLDVRGVILEPPKHKENVSDKSTFVVILRASHRRWLRELMRGTEGRAMAQLSLWQVVAGSAGNVLMAATRMTVRQENNCLDRNIDSYSLFA